MNRTGAAQVTQPAVMPGPGGAPGRVRGLDECGPRGPPCVPRPGRGDAMTAVLTEVRPWLRRRDPGLAGVRRAARVTVAACVGFYACRYGLGEPVMALYALFGTIALGMLSDVGGAPGDRTRALL